MPEYKSGSKAFSKPYGIYVPMAGRNRWGMIGRRLSGSLLQDGRRTVTCAREGLKTGKISVTSITPRQHPLAGESSGSTDRHKRTGGFKECVCGGDGERDRNIKIQVDWILWVTAFEENKEEQQALILPLVKYLEEMPTRNPFPVWYDILTAKEVHFHNRTVQGGIFMPMYRKTQKEKKNKLFSKE